MSLYQPREEQAIRTLRRVRDWRASQLISEAQHDRMAADLVTGLRRTNQFLRVTLFLFGLLIVLATVGLLILTINRGDEGLTVVSGMVAAACGGAAVFLVSRYSLYRFGIEEAFAVACIVLSAFAIALAADGLLTIVGGSAAGIGLLAGAVVAFAVFVKFGYVYAAMLGMTGAALAPFAVVESDVARRVIAVVILGAIYFAARLERGDHGDEFPGDSYGVVEAAAWAGMYLLLNLKASAWLSSPAESGPFYWITYVLIWMMPCAGLWIAVRGRHRELLDVNILLAIATLLSNKPYLGGEQKPWDPIVFGLLLTAVALGLRRWLASGSGGGRHGFVPYRLLASERERLAALGGLTVLQPSPHPSHPQESPEPTFGGGRSGGAGASGGFAQ